MTLSFRFEKEIAGCFRDLTEYPKEPGRYAYVPARSLAHARMFAQAARGVALTASYDAPEGVVTLYYRARIGAEREVLEIERVSNEPEGAPPRPWWAFWGR